MRRQGQEPRFIGAPRGASFRTAAAISAALRERGAKMPPTEPEITEVPPKNGRTRGEELRAWTVKLPYAVVTYRVGEFAQDHGHVLSELGNVLGCECTGSVIRRGYCDHAIAVAKRLGGRDVVAEEHARVDAIDTEVRNGDR